MGGSALPASLQWQGDLPASSGTRRDQLRHIFETIEGEVLDRGTPLDLDLDTISSASQSVRCVVRSRDLPELKERLRILGFELNSIADEYPLE